MGLCCRCTKLCNQVCTKHAAVIDADGKYLGKYRSNTFAGEVLGEVLLHTRHGGYPVFDTAVAKLAFTFATTVTFLKVACTRLNGAEIVFNPSATSRGLSEYIWRSSNQQQQLQHVLRRRDHRVGINHSARRFYGQSYFVDPEGKFVGNQGDHKARTDRSRS